MSYLSCQCLDGLKVEIVIQMEIVEVLTMDEEVEHVVSLSAYLQTNLQPIKLRGLEELCCLERPEQISGQWTRENYFLEIKDLIINELVGGWMTDDGQF